MIVLRVYTIVGGVLVAVFTGTTITLVLNWLNRLRTNLDDPDAYRYEVDAN